jgi:hypothetical protein
MNPTLTRLLDRLDAARRAYGPKDAKRVEQLLRRLRSIRLPDIECLLRWHDTLLFLRAFPQSPIVARLADELLATTSARVAELNKRGADLSLLDNESVSGIAGSEIVESWEFSIARWLAHKYPNNISIYWDGELNTARLANTLSRVVPLLDEDATVEPDVDWRAWIDAARGPQNDVKWLVDRFAALDLPERLKAELFESLEIPISLDLQDLNAARTHARRPVNQLYVHDAPLLQRKDVSLDRELSAPLKLRQLNPKDAAEIIDMARAALTVRYRGLYGMTFPSLPVYEATPGRGLQIFLWGVPPERRLPLRAYACGITLKNGVPINYLEAIALFDWVEVGFNTYYAFREGETAWVYAQVLRALRPLLGMNVVSVYPYQIGFENEEAIKSGAFWFYRKLGFRPGRPDLAALCEAEEKKIAADRNHRTSARNLRRLAEGHIFYDLPRVAHPGRLCQGGETGQWDRFRTRYLGLAVNQHIGAHFNGDTSLYRQAATASLARNLGVSLNDFRGCEREAFDNFAIALHPAPEIADWSAADKKALLDIIRARAAAEEWDYLRLLREHAPLRDAFLRLGSR